MTGFLTTHVLDTARGRPAADVPVHLYAADGSLLADAVTDADGRCAPLLSGETFRVGRYRLIFALERYFVRHHPGLPDPPFLNKIALDFGVADAAAHYHVPLLVSPYAYSTYRGS